MASRHNFQQIKCLLDRTGDLVTKNFPTVITTIQVCVCTRGGELSLNCTSLITRNTQDTPRSRHSHHFFVRVAAFDFKITWNIWDRVAVNQRGCPCKWVCECKYLRMVRVWVSMCVQHWPVWRRARCWWLKLCVDPAPSPARPERWWWRLGARPRAWVSRIC